MGRLSVVSNGVQVLIDVLRNALDLSVELIFNLEKIVLVTLGDEVNCNTKVTESSRSTNSMQVCFSILREVKINDNINGLNVDTSGKDICTYETTCLTIFEVVEDPIQLKMLETLKNVTYLFLSGCAIFEWM